MNSLRVIERIFPPSSRRRNLYDFGLRAGRVMANNGFKSALRKYAQYAMDFTKPTLYQTLENKIISSPKKGSFRELSRISIVIVTYNSAKKINSVLESTLRQKYPLDLLEIIIVDNKSSDNTEKIVNNFIKESGEKASIKFIKNQKSYGMGKANNIGFRESSSNTQYMMLLSPDCQLFDNTITHLVNAAISSMDSGYRLWECRQIPYEHPKHYNPITLETSWSSAACCLIEKKTFKEIGKFDENIFLHLKDVDISWRMRLNGFKLMYVPYAEVLHDSYDEPDKVESTIYYNSILYGSYLRYKYGNIKEILGYILMFSFLILNPTNGLNNERKNLLKEFINQFLFIPPAFNFRMSNKNKLKSFKPLFINFDFEIHRLGTFVESYIDKRNIESLPKVSIIIRTVGKKEFLREALASVRNQTYPNIEVVVIEDGPSTVEDMIRSEFNNIDVKYFALGTNHGRCYAGTYGLDKSSGKYLRFLDEDDLLYANSVETAVYYILKNKDKVKLVYDLAFEVSTEIVSENPLQYNEYLYEVKFNEDFSRESLFHHNFIPIQCALFDRELYEICGGFDKNLEVLEDWDLWIRYSMYSDFIKIPQVTSLYRVPADPNTNQRRHKKFDDYCNVVREKHGFSV